MNQSEILNLLKKERRYMTEKEIAKKAKCTQQSINIKLKKLKKSKFIQVKKRVAKKINRPVKHYRYNK